MGSSVVETSWRGFLRTRAAEREKFEERHPGMRLIRLATIFVPFPLAVIGGLTPVFVEPPKSYGVGLAFLMAAACVMLGSLFVYGMARWKEDRRVGEVALGIGFIPMLVLAVYTGVIIRDLVKGVSAFGDWEAWMGLVWFALAHILIWIFVGLVIDYHLYRGLSSEWA